MQVKFNKDALLRHRFWIMVGVAMFLSLSGIMYLQFTDAEAQREALKKDVTVAKGVKPEYNTATTEKQAEHAKKAMGEETRIWKQAFEAQQSEFKWALNVETEFKFYHGLFATNIKVMDKPAGDPKMAWPDTGPQQKELQGFYGVTHGIVLSATDDYVEIQARDGSKHEFKRTPSANYLSGIVDAKGGQMQVSFQIMKDFKALERSPVEALKKLGKDKFIAVTWHRGRYFGDPLTEREQKVFADSYAKQIRDILELVEPYTETGTGLVQLRDWPYRDSALPDKDKTFLRYVSADWSSLKDLSKEIWIAQENIWIQREIYKRIAEANDSISKFEDKGIDKQTKMRTFVNPYFEVRMHLDRTKNNSLKFIIKNLTDRRQKLDLTFKVNLRGVKEPAEPIYVSGNPLLPAGSKPVIQGGVEISDTLVLDFATPENVVRKEIFGLTQELSYQNAAVKRIDIVSIGSNADEKAGGISHSHRTFPEGLKSLEDANPVKPIPGLPVKAPDPVAMPPDPIRGGIGGGAGGAGSNKKPLEYELWTERYLEPPDQTRRVPICVSLIVDQDHVDRVLSKFNNSKLRLLLTQVLLNQYTGNIAPPAPVGEMKDGPKVMPPGGIGPIRGMGGFGFQPPPVAGAGGDSDSSMELVIYGVMTLYQRYPPRPPAGPSPDKK